MEDDGSTTKECVSCPTDDGCNECSDNICKSCLPGYFLSEDNLCYKCRAYQDGCDQCDNLNTCQVCSDKGFVLNKETNKCECDISQGFVKNIETKKCQCRDLTYNVVFDDKARVCAGCSELYPGCAKCIQSTTATAGSIQYLTNEGTNLYISCNQCKKGRINDVRNYECTTCAKKFGPDCSNCDDTECRSCKKGTFLNSKKTGCVECTAYHENCA